MRLPADDLPRLGAAVVTSAVGVATAEAALLGLAATVGHAGRAAPRRAAVAGQALEDCLTATTAARGNLLELAALLGSGDAAVHAVDAVLAARVLRLARPGDPFAVPGRVVVAGTTLGLREIASVLPPEVVSVGLAPFLVLDDGPGFAEPMSRGLPDGGTGATDLAGWLTRIDQLPQGQIAVTDVGDGRWVVQLPGIHSMLPEPDPQDLPDAAEALERGHSAYTRAVVQALGLACVPPGAQLMLVGHSQGGIVAADLARDPAVTARWRVTHVVTAGSPVSRIPVPAATRLLEVDNAADLVPDLDGTQGHDGAGRTVLRFDREHGSVGADHGLGPSYEPGLRQAESADPTVRVWVAGAAPYLHGGPAVTTVFRLLDSPPASR